jgi:hypothetical protein
MEPQGNTGPVALECGQDEKARPHARETGVRVGRVFVSGDASLG